jgi:bifunctional oligoribonuclease and PAP phosphatase NrnA
MNKKWKEVSVEILKEIKKSKNILLHLHVNPDPDSIGSALAMFWFLKNLGKKVTLIRGDSDLSESLTFLPGAKQIVKKNFFEIDLKKFDLFIILDSASKEMISRKSEIIFPDNLKTIIIDHHKTNKKFADINLIEPKFSATSEALFYLFKEWKVKIDKNIASNLYIGIYGDTGGFSYSNTTPETLKAITELVKIYPNFSNLINALRQNFSKEKVFFDSLALNSIETFFQDTVAISTISFKDLNKKGIKKTDVSANNIPNLLITVKKWVIGLTLIEKDPNQISISFRSKNNIDVSEIAKILGGGGHKLAAGAFLEMPISQAKEKVIQAIFQKYQP